MGAFLKVFEAREDMEIVAVVMGCETSKDRFAACKQLLDYGFASFALVSPQAEQADIPVKLGTADTVTAVPAGENSVLIDKSQKSSVTQQMVVEDFVQAPVSKGQRLGTLYIKAGQQVLKEIPLVAEQAVERLTFWQLWGRVLAKLAMAG